MICKTIKFELERESSNASITQVSERLDFRTLLARASAGIIDLNQYQIPRESDVQGSQVGDPANSQALEDLMNRPPSVLDYLFGASIEDAERELQRHQSVISQHQKKHDNAEKEPLGDDDKAKYDDDAT